jgi:HK97 family phage major capsid protein
MYTKAAGNMTTPTNLTGDPNITYIPTPVILPRQLINFRDLVPGFQSSTGLIVLFREDVIGGNPNNTPQQGAIQQQLTQGALKEQIGYTFTDVQFNAQYISGFVRVSKQMLQDLLFLQTYLPQMLLRDYYKAENRIFQAAQAANSLGSTTTSGGNDAEKFIDYITNLEDTNFAPNAIVTTPTVWGKLMKTTVPSIGTSYSAPGGFYINPRTGDIEIAGIPIVKATWMPSGTAFTADWTQTQVATVDNLKVEFFEQDSDNVQRNLITVRVEARVVLVPGQPYAFSYATGL